MDVPSSAIVRAVDTVFYVFYVALLVRIILSFVRLPPWHWAQRSIGRVAFSITEPVLAPIRRWIERYQRGSPFDFSPLIAWILADWIVRPLLVRLITALIR